MHEVRCVTLFTSLQLVNSNGQFINMTDSVTIFYYKDLILYQVPYKREISNFKVDTVNNSFHQELVKTETRFTYFIYKKNNSYGFECDSINAKNYQIIPVDSFLKNTTFQSVNFFDKKNDSLVRTIKDSKNNMLIEKYIPKIKFDQSYCDTTCLYFTQKFKNIDFTFSKELDSLKKMKLFKVRFIYNRTVDVLGREFLFELKENASCNSKEITQFFENLQH